MNGCQIRNAITNCLIAIEVQGPRYATWGDSSFNQLCESFWSISFQVKEGYTDDHIARETEGMGWWWGGEGGVLMTNIQQHRQNWELGRGNNQMPANSVGSRHQATEKEGYHLTQIFIRCAEAEARETSRMRKNPTSDF